MSLRVLRNRGRLVSREGTAEYDATFEFHLSSDAKPGVAQTIWGDVSAPDNIPLPVSSPHVHQSLFLSIKQIGKAADLTPAALPSLAQLPVREDPAQSY